MHTTSSIAFKEWAAVCAALAEGRQAIILRKGGIHEGRAGFRVAHDEFWLYPTYLHEGTDGLVDNARPLLERALAERPPIGTLQLALYAVVTDVIELNDQSKLARLDGQHAWSPQIVSARFHYRQPGLFVLVVRMYRQAEPFVIPESPHFAGCRSWVELPEALPTERLAPVLGEGDFEQLRAAALNAVSTT